MTDPSPRDSLGLTSAGSGDVSGVERFLRFVYTECLQLSWANLPPDVRQRLLNFACAAQLEATFMAGVVSAQPKHDNAKARPRARKGKRA